MIIPQYYCDVTGTQLTEIEMLHVHVTPAPETMAPSQEYHVSQYAATMMFLPCEVRIGEILRLLREKQLITADELMTLEVSTRAVPKDDFYRVSVTLTMSDHARVETLLAQIPQWHPAIRCTVPGDNSTIIRLHLELEFVENAEESEEQP